MYNCGTGGEIDENENENEDGGRHAYQLILAIEHV